MSTEVVPAVTAPAPDAAQAVVEAMDALAQAILSKLIPVPPEHRAQVIAWKLHLFAAAWLRIRTKDGGPLARFAFNWVQDDFLRKLRKRYRRPGDLSGGLDRFRGVRANVLKPRQLGFSTFIAALFFVDGFLNPGRTAVVVTHLQKMSEELLRTYRIFWDYLPGEVKQGLSLATASKYEFAIQFPSNGDALNTDSRFIIWTERGEDFRGGKIDNLHGSEAAYYKDYLGWKTAFFQAVGPAGNIVLETTANGMNPYYDDVQACLREGSSWWLVFYPWHQHGEYRRVWEDGVQPEISDWERDQMALHGWSLEQLAWRRWKVGEIGSEERFRQEFPATVDEAFLTTGRPFFPMVEVKARLDHLGTRPVPCSTPRPDVRIFEGYIPGDLYVLAADVAEGLDAGSEVPGSPERGGTDFCCAYVLHAASLRVVAMIHGRIPPGEFARLCDWLGRQYRACVAPERNNHGHTVVHVLQEAWYPWLYRHLEYDAAGSETFLKAGFPTNNVTRPQILDALWQAIKAGLLYCPDLGFWRECTTFHRGAGGKPEAMEGYHDDRVIALAIAVYLCSLGRVAWGAPAGDWADATGMPVSAHEQGLAIPAVPALPPPPPPAPVSDVPGLAALASAPKPGTCGSCSHCRGGLCRLDEPLGGICMKVEPGDPGCWAWLGTSAAPMGDIWGDVIPMVEP